MADAIRSIFRQREVEKLYELCVRAENGTNVFNCITITKIIAVENTEKVISDKEIGRYDIEIPMLEVGDEFFLHDIQEVIVIKSRMRSSDGSITYYVKDKIIDTENTQKSYEECSEKIKHWNQKEEEYIDLKNRLDDVKKEFRDYKKEYKYKNRFFNKKITD